MTETYQKALNYAFLLLKYRPRSVREMRDRLERKAFSSSDIEKVIRHLSEYGYLDDVLFARLFARDKVKRGYGRKRITYELLRLGIGFEQAKTALTEADREIDSVQVLKDLAERAMAGKQDREKVVQYLLRRGFSLTEILKVLNNED